MLAHHTRRGFTLIELILVVSLLTIITAVTLPSLVNSMRGNRLRFAARSVVMTGRYARSMAVMEQVDMGLTFDLDTGRMSVAGVGVGPRSPEAGERDLDEVRSDPDAENEASVAVKRAAGAGGAVGLSRTLDRVRITRVEMPGDEEGAHTDGTCTIPYRTNGSCDPYTVEIEDQYGAGMTIHVDALSSSNIEAKTP